MNQPYHLQARNGMSCVGTGGARALACRVETLLDTVPRYGVRTSLWIILGGDSTSGSEREVLYSLSEKECSDEKHHLQRGCRVSDGLPGPHAGRVGIAARGGVRYP